MSQSFNTGRRRLLGAAVLGATAGEFILGGATDAASTSVPTKSSGIVEFGPL